MVEVRLSSSWRETFQVYKDRRMLKVLLLGCISGYPWVAIGSALTLFLREIGISRTETTLLTGIGIAYALNLLWAPLLDITRAPLWRIKGQRISWILCCQLLITLALGGMALMGLFTPESQTTFVLIIASLALIIAISGATADIAIDALRIELFSPDEPRKVGAAAAMATSGWWLSYGFGGALLFLVVDALNKGGELPSPTASWHVGFSLFMLVPLAFMLAIYLWLHESEPKRVANAIKKGHLASASASALAALSAEKRLRELVLNLGRAYASPVIDFARRYGLKTGLLILLAIVLFKSGEAFLGRMSLIFYQDIGFSMVDIALVSKIGGPIITVIFAIAGSVINARYGLLRGFILGGIFMAATNLLFSVLAVIGPVTEFFLFAVLADQITSAIATVVLVAFISQLCSRDHTATHYAALASLGNLSRTTLASGSGWTMEHLLGESWFWFFILTALMVLPSLFIIISLRKKVQDILAPLAHPSAPHQPREESPIPK